MRRQYCAAATLLEYKRRMSSKTAINLYRAEMSTWAHQNGWISIDTPSRPPAGEGQTSRELSVDDKCLANTRAALEKIKGKGYLLAASTLREGSIDILDVPVDRPLAVMIGTELTGLTQAAHDMADITFSMPMYGFVQSVNLSVFSALCLNILVNKMRNYSEDWKLPEEESEALMLDWLGRCLASAKDIL